MYSNPLWFCVTYLTGRARQRALAARAGHPESGALTLEWIVIAGILVTAAVAAAIVFKKAITGFESKLNG
ncbi:MAG TPA: hypothetical protein VMV07_01350 [Streptosporangiaceae bacterium]|nr:hypothetical protein [Streptosporangiaceae bacterium]